MQFKKKSLSKEVAFGVRVQTCAKLNQVNQSISLFKKYYSTQSVLLDWKSQGWSWRLSKNLWLNAQIGQRQNEVILRKIEK